jgi:hypothetical protein
MDRATAGLRLITLPFSTCFALFSLLPAALASADAPRVPRAVAEAPGREAYPDDDGLVVRQITTLALDAAGMVTRAEESWIRNFTPWVNAHGAYDPDINWNDARSTLRVDFARTVTPDGRELDARAESLVPNTAPELEPAPAFAHLRQMTISQVGIEDGSTTGLGYTVADRRPSGLPLWGVADFGGALPIAERTVSIRVPAGVGLKWAAVGCTIPHEVENDAGAARHFFQRMKIPAVNTAELAGGHAGLCRLVYSTAGDWGRVRALLEAGVVPAIEAGARAGSGRSVADKARQIAGEDGLDAERIAKLHAFVVDGIQTVHWPLDAFDYAVRPAPEVLATSYGHPLEKAALLAALLGALGYDARVALAAAERGAALDVPAPVLLDQAWVRVTLGPQVLWLDPTAPLDRHGAFSLAGRAVLVLDGKAAAPDVQPELDAIANRAAARYEAKLDDTGDSLKLTGREELDLGGLYNPLPAFDRTKDRLAGVASSAASALFAKASAQEIVVGQKSAQLTALAAGLSGSIAIPRDGRPVRIVLPRVPGAVSSDSLQLYRNRRTLQLRVPAPAEERVELVLTLPEGSEPLALPADVTIEEPAASFARTVTRDGAKVTIRTLLRLKQPLVAPADYPGLRRAFAAMETESGRTLLVQLKPR